MQQLRLRRISGEAVAIDPAKVVAVTEGASAGQTTIHFTSGWLVEVKGDFGTIADRVWNPDDLIA